MCKLSAAEHRILELFQRYWQNQTLVLPAASGDLDSKPTFAAPASRLTQEKRRRCLLCGPTRLLHVQLLLLQHFLACAATHILQRSEFHQSGH
jgi:hypothetical protein